MGKTSVSRILVPVDYSKHSERVLEYALNLGKSFEAVVHVVHVYDTVPFHQADVLMLPTSSNPDITVQEALRREARQSFDHFLDRCAAHGIVPLSTDIIEGSPATSIVTYAQENGFDLIVMGKRGRTGISSLLLGSVAQRVMEHAHCPVLTVPPT